MTHAARAGIIIKSGAHMERLAEVDTVVFDKTGTLSQGVPGVVDVIAYQEKHYTRRQLIGLVAAAETRVKHPVAEAMRAKAEEWEVPIEPCSKQAFSRRSRRRGAGQRHLCPRRQRAFLARERHQDRVRREGSRGL